MEKDIIEEGTNNTTPENNPAVFSLATRLVTQEIINGVTDAISGYGITVGDDVITAEADFVTFRLPKEISAEIISDVSAKVMSNFEEQAKMAEEDKVENRAMKGLNNLTEEERGTPEMDKFVFSVKGEVPVRFSQYLSINLNAFIGIKGTVNNQTEITIGTNSLSLGRLAQYLNDLDLVVTKNDVIKKILQEYTDSMTPEDIDADKEAKRFRIRQGYNIIHP